MASDQEKYEAQKKGLCDLMGNKLFIIERREIWENGRRMLLAKLAAKERPDVFYDFVWLLN